jgi:hypothetical protein
MKIEIKNRFTNEIIICGEYESIKDCLEKNKDKNLRFADLRSADLSSANLRSADLSSANLRSADLRSADLRYAKNIKLPIMSIIGSKHSLWYSNNQIIIGCIKLTIEAWIEKYKQIGRKYSYSETEIEEYHQYILAIKKIASKEKRNESKKESKK